MGDIEEQIPSFHTWKMFNETIVPALINMESSESTLEKLSGIVKTREFSKIFVCNHDPTISFDEHQQLCKNYKAFTVWLLGQFFYLLNCSQISRMHDLIIEVQWRILLEISRTQPHIYDELASEYLLALKALNEFYRNSPFKPAQLEFFVPTSPSNLSRKLDMSPISIDISSLSICHNMQLKTILLVEKIVLNNIKLGWLDGVTNDSLDCLLCMLTECDMSLKLAVLEAFVKILQQDDHFHFMTPTIRQKLYMCAGLLEQIVFLVYNKKIEANLVKLESILQTIFSVNNLDARFVQVANYLASQEVSSNLQHAIYKHLQRKQIFELTEDLDLDDCVEAIFNKKQLKLCIERKIYFEIITYINTNVVESKLNVQDFRVSQTWNNLSKVLEMALKRHYCCASLCQIEVSLCLSQILNAISRIMIEVQHYLIEEKSTATVQLIFFSEVDILSQILKLAKEHFENCNKQFLSQCLTTDLLNILIIIPTMYVVTDYEFIFHCLSQPFFSERELILRTALNKNKEFAGIAKAFSYHVDRVSADKKANMEFLSSYMQNLSFGLVDINNKSTVNKSIGAIFYKMAKTMVQETNFALVELKIFKAIIYFPTIISSTDDWIRGVLMPLLKMKLRESLLVALLESISDIICKSKSKYIQPVSWNLQECSVSVKLFCLTCENGEDQNKSRMLKRLQTPSAIYGTFPPIGGSDSLHQELLKQILPYVSHSSLLVRKAMLKTLKSLSHVPSLITSSDNIKTWMKFAGDEDGTIRRDFASIIYFVLKELPNLVNSKTQQAELWDVYLTELREYSRDSIQNSKYDLQNTLIKTIDSFSMFNVDIITLRVTQLVLFFMLFPTSRYSEMASNIFIEMAKERSSETVRIFSQYKKELCKLIADVCSVNHSAFKYTLCTSLEKLSLVLGYFEAKNFIAQENKYLLPYFVSILIKKPHFQLEALLNEMAAVSGLTLSELLLNRYGNIFLHIFLNEPEDHFKKCTKYVEGVTGVAEITLLKRNSLAILHELLLNFHDHQERVLTAITILAQEDLEDVFFNSQQVPSYLQPKFLGVLSYFDLKLVDKLAPKKNVLLSLARLLTFMGPKHITPLRFKILATLTTYLKLTLESDVELNCDVWNAFIRSCEIEALGPQLATIFVALLPLMQKCPHKIHNIFKYIIIDNEDSLKDYICDLFFIVNVDVSIEICLVVRKYLEPIESLPFKEHLSSFFKYLNHETTDIRIYGLKYVKQLLQNNREKLNQMILGFNGIDPIILQLLDVLMLICREKDYSLKLACGECIGELGAIEPSHLPQKYMEETKKFIFFITEDGFIVNALNELTRALQAEKNTRSMDRFALATQEILKEYDISPDCQSKKYNLWISFPEAQRELMLPLLSSRYAMILPFEGAASTPIYGSKLGGTFHMWITNWISNLILCIDATKRPLLQVCLPSLKQDHKTLMHFLPHILLHVLLENGNQVHQTVYTEIEAVISAVNSKQSKPNAPCPSKFASCTPSPQTEEAQEIQCIKIVFVLLDFLNRWVRESTWNNEELRSQAQDSHRLLLKRFLNRFNKLQLAYCNYQSGEFPRALLYLEEYIECQPNDLNNQLPFLAEIYAQLDEPDGVAGVTVLQTTEPSLEQRVLALEVSGKLADAAACYEQMPQPLKIHHVQGLLRCYLDLENVNTAWNFAEGAMKIQPENTNILFEEQAEALWRLFQYDRLNELINKPELVNNNSWNVQMGRSLLHLRKNRRDEFKTSLDCLRLAQVDALGAASLKEGAYSHGYTYIAKLHAINELQQTEQTIHELLIRPNDRNVSDSLIKKLMSGWDLRLKVVQESVRIQEPILCLRRVAIEQAKTLLEHKVPHSLQLLNALLGELWLLSANIARDAGVHHQAYTYTLRAEQYAPPRLFLEKAKLQWLKEEREQALATLRRGIENLLPQNLSNSSNSLSRVPFENRKLAAEARLLIASYNDSISNVDTETNIQHYKEAVEVFKEWEKSLVCLGQYYDRLFQTLPDHEKDTKGGDMQVHMVNYFGKSLVYGSKFVYQSMPRMLSIWFDCGTRLLDVPSNDDRHNTLLKLTKIIDMYLERLPAYIFFTAFSQLVSRICHPQKQVYLELKSIIIKLILQYPQQSLWMIMSVRKSSYSIRSKRCDEILNDSRLKTLSMIKLVGDFTKLAEKLIELCNKELPDNMNSASVNNLLRALPRLITKEDFSKIMIPTQKFRKLILPNPDFQSNEHNAFPNHYVHIVGIEDEITILQSLQHPRKITFKGSDGKKYVQMLKPKDDLRKDFRLMEFNDIVNQLLSREADSRQRRLNIRLYSVVPLNEECGLIEWIPNLVGLRPILLSLYKQKGLGVRGRELKQLCCNQRDPITKKRDTFTKQLIPKHPPILGEWFKKNFVDAQSWLTARTAYSRTLAVMSMVGYILGLGDRHGENILFDSTSGDIVHVDFNCLFNKGETFEWPERVPFRLTHNMVAAMGALGVEGTFRKSCCCTLRVLRSHSTTLMSIVTPFVYDPLVSWPRNAAASSAQTSERTNEQAKEHIRNIDLRLQGIIKTKGRSFSIPLSVEGQTNNLIEEAISIDNLSQMYIGWGAYL